MRVVLRCDASPTLGLGHLRRCLSLAQALGPAARVSVAAHALGPGLRELVAAAGHGLVELEQVDDVAGVRAAARELGADWVVVDSYAWGPEALARCADPAWRLCVLDDEASRDLRAADLIVDPTPGPPRPGGLFGPRYALLDAAFPAQRAASLTRRRAGRGRALVTLGGAPPLDSLRRVAAGLEASGVGALDLLLGVRAPEGVCGPRRTLHGPLDPTGVAALMRAADLAVATPSTTAWELACLGIPSVLVPTAANQARNAAALGALGVPVVAPEEVAAGLAQLDAPVVRKRWATLCDGLGATRVAAALAGEPEELVVLPSDGSREQAAQVLAWRNDPRARAMSTADEAIDWDDHWRWWSQLQTDPERLQLLGWLEGEPCGAIRFDALGDGSARVSLVVAPSHRGRGLASRLLDAALEPLVAWGLAVSRLRAEIRPDNVPSLRAFERAGYRREPALGNQDLTVWVRELTQPEGDR